MPCRLHGLVSVCLSLTVVWSMMSATASAQTVWSGLTYSFERPDGVEGTLPEHQDAMTPNVVLTRGTIGTGYLQRLIGDPEIR